MTCLAFWFGSYHTFQKALDKLYGFTGLSVRFIFGCKKSKYPLHIYITLKSTKQVSEIRKCHNDIQKTNQLHREEKTKHTSGHTTAVRPSKITSSLFLKQMSVVMKYTIHTLKTNQRHHDEETEKTNSQTTARRQIEYPALYSSNK